MSSPEFMPAALPSLLRRLAVGLLWLCLSACTSLLHKPAASTPEAPAWSGRLAIRVPDQPSQSFSASFELHGSAPQGQLILYSPLGSTVAQLDWDLSGARLRTPQQQRDYSDLETLVQQATGTAFPVAALFDWLNGKDAAVEGWQVDLSQQAQGRLVAHRAEPPAELKLLLDPP